MQKGEYARVTSAEMDIILHEFAKKEFGRDMNVFVDESEGLLGMSIMLEDSKDAARFKELYDRYDEEGFGCALEDCGKAPEYTTYPHIITTRILAEFLKEQLLFKAGEVFFKDGMFVFLSGML